MIKKCFMAIAPLTLVACNPSAESLPEEPAPSTLSNPERVIPSMPTGSIEAGIAGDMANQRDQNGTGERTTYNSPEKPVPYSDSQGKYIRPQR